MAGCTGGKATPKVVATAPSVAPDAQVDANRGAIRGFVVDPEAAPVPLTQLLLRPGELTTTAATDGGFVFNLLEPGTYTLLGSRLGYTSNTLQVAVAAGQTTPAEFLLKPVAVSVPHHQIIGPYAGYFQCRWGLPLVSGPCGAAPAVDTSAAYSQVWTHDVNRFEFQMQGEDWTEIVFEAKWTPSTLATNSKMNQVFSFKERESTHWFARSNVTDSPLKWSFVKGVKNPLAQMPSGTPQEPTSNMTLRTWLATPSGSTSPTDPRPAAVAYEMRFELVTTVFYNQHAPKDWTALST